MSRYSNIKAVVFDAVGTVMYPEPSVSLAYQNALKEHCGVEVETEIIAGVLRRRLAERSAVDDLSTNEEAEHQFWADLIQEFCPNSPGFDDCFFDLFHHFQQSSSWRCFTDVGSTLQTLCEHNIAVGIASNFDRRLNSVCDGLGDLAAADVRIISSVVGWRKPAAEFFQAVMDAFDLPAEQILMVGDDLQNDVVGALTVGMPAVLISRGAVPAEDLPTGAVAIDALDQLIDLLQIRDSHTDAAE